MCVQEPIIMGRKWQKGWILGWYCCRCSWYRRTPCPRINWVNTLQGAEVSISPYYLLAGRNGGISLAHTTIICSSYCPSAWSPGTGWLHRGHLHQCISFFSSIAYETSNSPTGDCQTFKWFIPVMAKALQSPAPAPQQLLAVWETSGHQRVLLGPSESWPGRPKAKINKGALLYPLPSLLCAVTCAFLKRMACSPPHPHSWEDRSCKMGFGGKLREGLQGWVVCRGVHGQDLLPLCRGDVSYVCPCVCAQARVCMHARILHAQNLCTQAHPSACANRLLKQVKNTAWMSRGMAQAPDCTSWFPVPKAAVVADYPSRFLWHPRF